MTLAAPVPLAEPHDLDGFDCGIASLNDWLKRRARANQIAGASRTYVVCDGNRAIGYHALASGAVTSRESSGRFRRNMPDPIPVVVLGRLAISRSYQGQGLGRMILRDAARRVIQAAEIVGIRGMLVQAISAQARDFYIAMGLEASPLDPMTLMATLGDLRRAFAA